jgi:hypothetical protein
MIDMLMASSYHSNTSPQVLRDLGARPQLMRPLLLSKIMGTAFLSSGLPVRNAAAKEGNMLKHVQIMPRRMVNTWQWSLQKFVLTYFLF